MEARKKPSGMTRDLTGGRRSWRCWRCYMETPTSLVAGILIVLVWILACSTLAECRYEAVDVMLDEFDFYNSQSHDPLYRVFFDVLNSTVPRFAYADHVYLGVKDEDRATLAFSDNDLYLRAFQNNEGTWHVFAGYEHMFPGAVVINSNNLDETYVKLVGGHKNMQKIPLGRDAAVGAARTLGRYRHGITPEPELKIALIQYMIMISEGLRIRPIREQFSYRWGTESHLTELQTKYVLKWADLSKLMFIFERDNVWDISKGTGKQVLDALKISNANQALEILDFFRRPKQLRTPDF